MNGFDMLDAVDFAATTHDTVALLLPQTTRAHADAADLFPDALYFGAAIGVELRYLPDCLAGLLEDGYRVSLNGREVASIERV